MSLDLSTFSDESLTAMGLSAERVGWDDLADNEYFQELTKRDRTIPQREAV